MDERGWNWTSDHLPPDGEVVETKIHDSRSCRNEQRLKRRGRLWWLEDDSMYVYYTPTHWRPVQRRREAVNRPEHRVEMRLTEALGAAVELGNEVNKLRAAMREIASEVSAIGCEGADDAICMETNRAKEDWCPYCRIGMIIRDAS